MDHNSLAKEVIALYPISNPKIEFIRHNENMTFKITDKIKDKSYLLRIHKPCTEGLLGIQHTFEGIKSEISILRELSNNSVLKVQNPIKNSLGEYVTKHKFKEFKELYYATLLEWIEGPILTPEEENINEIAFSVGENLAILHNCLREFKPEKDFKRPTYDIDKIDVTIEELKYCVDANLFSMEQYELIREVLIIVKDQLRALGINKNTWGIIHADLQLGNIIVNEGKPCLIDFGFSGFGHYLFDLASGATIFKNDLREKFLNGYASKGAFSFKEIRYIEGFIFMDIFISYVLFMRDSNKNQWIKSHASKVCDKLCNKFIEGKEVFYSF